MSILYYINNKICRYSAVPLIFEHCRQIQGLLVSYLYCSIIIRLALFYITVTIIPATLSREQREGCEKGLPTTFIDVLALPLQPSPS